jgi:hypothetical protein
MLKIQKLLGMLRGKHAIACYNQKGHDFQQAIDDEEVNPANRGTIA